MREKYSFADLEQLSEYLKIQEHDFGTCTRLCICFIGGQLSLIQNVGTEPHVIGVVDVPAEETRPKYRNPYDQQDYDLEFNVQADVTGKSYKLYMNIGEDAYVVSKRFLSQTGL